MQGLLGSYRWDWEDLRAELPALAAAWIPDAPDDRIGPGLAIDETAQLKHGDTACVAPQHAGCTGKVENCVTTVFSAYVTAHGQTWVDFDLYMPDRWANDDTRRQAAGIPADLEFATKPQLAIDQLKRLATAGLPIRWVAFDEVYGRSEELRRTAARAGLAYVAVIPCNYQVRLPSGKVLEANQAAGDAVFERCSCGNGSKVPRYSDWAMLATAVDGQYLLVRKATMTYFITIAGRRWPVEETFKTGKDVLGWDQTQARTWNSTCRHTALAALAQLRAAAVRGALTGAVALPAASRDGQEANPATPGGHHHDDSRAGDPDLQFPVGDAPVPARAGLPCPPGIARSSCRSPRPPGSPASPRATQPGWSPAPGWRSRSATAVQRVLPAACRRRPAARLHLCGSVWL